MSIKLIFPNEDKCLFHLNHHKLATQQKEYYHLINAAIADKFADITCDNLLQVRGRVSVIMMGMSSELGSEFPLAETMEKITQALKDLGEGRRITEELVQEGRKKENKVSTTLSSFSKALEELIEKFDKTAIIETFSHAHDKLFTFESEDTLLSFLQKDLSLQYEDSRLIKHVAHALANQEICFNSLEKELVKCLGSNEIFLRGTVEARTLSVQCFFNAFSEYLNTK